MSAITLNNICMSIGSRVLFENVAISFLEGQRVALTGPNGAGKSTLLKIIMGSGAQNYGTVSLPSKVGMLRQNIEDFADDVVMDVVIMGNKKLWSARCEQNKLYESEITDAVGMRLGELEEIIAEEDGYSAESSAEELLVGMGVAAEYHQQNLGEIPVDLQFRVMLCQALFGNPQALLLDEPTNHLDMESIGWLEEFLMKYRGVLVVVSHDRHFLNSIATHVADIDYETIIMYTGNYDQMIETKMAVRSRAEADAKSKQKKIDQLREFVSKFGAGTRASQVQSRKREMERLAPQDLKKSNIDRPYIRFIPSDVVPGKIVAKVEKASKTYDKDPVITGLELEIQRGDKIGIIGNNGRGKTTLIKMLVGALQPTSGAVTLGHNVQVSYFPQNHAEIVDKSDTRDIATWLQALRPGIYDQEIRSALGKMLFGGDDAFKKVATLSGGETARLMLASMTLTSHNTLILDEPNNHLDLEAVSALTWGLEEYKGTVIVASHDRDLLSALCTKLIAFEDDGIHFYEGGLDAYLETRNSKKS